MKTPSKVDLYALNKDDYATPKKPILLVIKPATYLAIEGKGAPGGPLFEASIAALYGTAYTIKMTRKFGGRRDYTICKLEGIWWSDASPNFAAAPKQDWQWKLLIRTPEFVQQNELDKAVTVLLERGKGDEVKKVRLEVLEEGKCVQMLHVGPYEKEHETMALIEAFAASQGLQFSGRHHEIYLSDPRRVPPERLRTILRQPVTRKD